MKTSKSIAMLTMVVGAALGLAGCESTGTSGAVANTDGKGSYYGITGGNTVAAQPAATKAPAAAPAKPAAAPAAKAAEPAKPAAAPAARAAEPAKPAAAPAMAGGGSGRSYRPNVPAGSMVNSLAFPTGDIATSALLVNRIQPTQVRVGQDVAEEIHVTNLTAGELSNVMVSLSGFDNYTIKSSTPPAMTGGTAGTLNWNVGNLKGGETKVIKLTGAAMKVGTTASCVNANYSNTLCMGTSVVEPALKIVKAITPAAGTPCDTYTVKLTVTNSGTGSADNVKVSDQLPAGMTTADGKNTFEQVVGNLASGQSRDITFPVKVAKAGAYNNDANAMADGGLSAKSNAVTATVTAPSLDLKLNCPPARSTGQQATFQVVVTNTGDAPCTSTVTVTPPAGASFVSADMGGSSAGGKINWSMPLAPKESKTLSYIIRAGSAGALATSVTANCSNCAVTPPVVNCTTQVQGVPDIGTSISDADGVRTVGENHEYTYTVVNQGQVDLTGVTVNATLTEGASFISATSSAAPVVNGRNLVFNVGTVKVGQTVSFKILTKGDRAGELGIDTETKCNELKRTVRNDEQVTFIDR